MPAAADMNVEERGNVILLSGEGVRIEITDGLLSYFENEYSAKDYFYYDEPLGASSGMQTQLLEMDYILVTSPDGDVPKADANFFEALWFEIKSFFR